MVVAARLAAGDWCKVVEVVGMNRDALEGVKEAEQRDEGQQSGLARGVVPRRCLVEEELKSC